jgi:rSAM/selenodomain-associated transferase 1
MTDFVLSYPILNPEKIVDRETRALRSSQCALAVMAKAPRAGKVKTRLAPPLTLDQSAALNVCFLQDTTQNLADVASAGNAVGIISYTPVGDEALFNGLLPADFALIPQRSGDFGERLFHAAKDILACGYGSVCLIDSDSPTVPTASYRRAVELLARPGDRIVLGPSDDGGYYLIGLKRPHSEPFTDISWSTGTVAAETRQRCYKAYLDLAEIPLWYDVDDASSLEILSEELLQDTQPSFATGVGYPAPKTREMLLKLRRERTS